MSAERAADVAALLDGGTTTPGATLPRVATPDEGTGPGETTGRVNGAPARGPGRPPRDPSQLSMSPEAIRARRRRDKARGANGQNVQQDSQGAPASVRSFTPAVHREPAPPPPPPPPPPRIEDVAQATGFVRRLLLLAGVIAAKLLKDERMNVPEEDAQEAAKLIVDAWPELAALDADGKKWLAVLYVGSLVGERYGQYQRQPAASPSLSPDKPAGEPVAVVDAPPTAKPAPRSSMMMVST